MGFHLFKRNPVPEETEKQVTHLPGVTPGHLHSGVQWGGGSAIEDQSMTPE